MGWCPKCDIRYPNTVTFCPKDGTTLINQGAASNDPLINLVLDERYHIDSLIGTGAMGRVYKATQINVGRDVAVKVLNAVASQNAEVVTRFQSEARIISELRHPNTLKLLDFGHTPEGQLFIVLELLKGCSLEDELAKGAMSEIRVMSILKQSLSALAEAHEQGIVHRDIKPANIMIESVGGSEIVKVVDFGIAKVMSGINITATGRVIGTPAYMSPEQVQGTTITASSDLYSLGVVAYECLCGLLPFVGSTAVSVMLKHMQTPVPRPQDLETLPALHPDVEAFVLSLLEKSPSDRPANAVTAKREVERLERVLMGGARDSVQENRVAGASDVHQGANRTRARQMATDETMLPDAGTASQSAVIEQSAGVSGTDHIGLADDLGSSTSRPIVLILLVVALCVGGYFALGSSASKPDGESAPKASKPIKLGTKNTTTPKASKTLTPPVGQPNRKITSTQEADAERREVKKGTQPTKPPTQEQSKTSAGPTATKGVLTPAKTQPQNAKPKDLSGPKRGKMPRRATSAQKAKKTKKPAARPKANTAVSKPKKRPINRKPAPDPRPKKTAAPRQKKKGGAGYQDSVDKLEFKGF